MAAVDKDPLNAVAKMTDVHAGAQPTNELFNGAFVFGVDAFPAFAFKSAMGGQDVDGAYGRAINAGRGVVGEGGDGGPGVVGIAGDVIANPGKPFPRLIWNAPFLGRGWRAGVVGFGADPGTRGERGGGKNDAVGVLGHAEKSVGVWGRSTALPGILGTATAHAGVYGAGPMGGIGDGSSGWIGVEGISGAQWGVYGHVNYKSPNADMIGVVGAAALDLGHPENTVGRAALFMGPVDVDG